MGTNFYRVKQITNTDKQKLHSLIDSDNIIGIDYETVESYLNDLKEEIHICKRSGGWQICFDHNKGKYYQPNRKSLEEFLSEPNTEIKNEYGEVISYKDFWKMVNEWNSDPHNNWTSKSYNKWEKEQNPDNEYWNSSYQYYLDLEGRKFCREHFGIEPEDNDFSVDGLRFAVYSDFS